MSLMQSGGESRAQHTLVSSTLPSSDGSLMKMGHNQELFAR